MTVKIVRNIFIGVAAACMFLPVLVAASDDDPKKAAIAAAEKWIADIDAGNYASCWEEASEVFRSTISRDRWAYHLSMLRDPLGRVMTRTIDTASLVAIQPGINDERNGIVRFKTSYRNFKSATETVMLTPDTDGRWRIMGYYITSGFLIPRGLNAAILLVLVIIGAWYLELKHVPGGRRNN